MLGAGLGARLLLLACRRDRPWQRRAQLEKESENRVGEGEADLFPKQISAAVTSEHNIGEEGAGLAGRGRPRAELQVVATLGLHRVWAAVRCWGSCGGWSW